MDNKQNNLSRKIIHIDMDCFYAAVEIRDNPALAKLPVAVGGSADRRGVLCTCNYVARKYGVHSAMPTSYAKRLCPELVVLPVNFAKYKDVSKRIQAMFKQFTNLVEPLALDEAFLDVTNSEYCNGSAMLIAEEIRRQIWQNEHLTASAGVASNKLLAKIGSGYNKPNGIFVIRPHEIDQFMQDLPVNKLFGVGSVTLNKLKQLNISTCNDLQQLKLNELIGHFGNKFGQGLYYQCRGIDERSVNPNRVRKSLSVEETFIKDLTSTADSIEQIKLLHVELLRRLDLAKIDRPIKSQFIKIKFNNFKQITAELASEQPNVDKYLALFSQAYTKYNIPIRLLGIGVHFDHSQNNQKQLSLFN
jgi:DNA polymerase IV